MIENGTIKKFAMITDSEKIGYQICAYFSFDLSDPKLKDELGTWLASLPNTAYVHGATNLFDLSTRIFFKDIKDMNRFIDQLEKDERIKDFKFDIIRDTYKVGPVAPM